jgi:arylformamidase
MATGRGDARDAGTPQTVKVVDLTRPLSPDTLVFEGDPPVTATRVRTHARDGYQVTALTLGTHSGTHLDAPRHFVAGGATLDDYPVDRLVRPGWVVDVRPGGGPEGGGAAPGTAATPVVSATLLAERLRDAQFEAGDFLLLWTGGALLAADAAPLLLATGAGLVGTDAESLDDDPYPVHQLLLGAGVLLAENLTNLEELGAGPVMCAFLPLAIANADGAPVRAVAWKEDGGRRCGSTTPAWSAW